MLTTHVTLWDKYNYLDEKFQKAFAFLRSHDLASLPEGTVEIAGKDIYASVQHYTTGTPEACRFESHEKYFDVQMVVSGEEAFGYAPRQGLTVSVPYSEENDIVFYKEPEKSSSVTLQAGDFIIVAPEDAHAPRRMTAVGPCEVKKIVVKVKA